MIEVVSNVRETTSQFFSKEIVLPPGGKGQQGFIVPVEISGLDSYTFDIFIKAKAMGNDMPNRMCQGMVTAKCIPTMEEDEPTASPTTTPTGFPTPGTPGTRNPVPTGSPTMGTIEPTIDPIITTEPSPTASPTSEPTEGGPTSIPSVGGPTSIPSVGGPSSIPSVDGPTLEPSEPTEGGPTSIPSVGGPTSIPSVGGPTMDPMVSSIPSDMPSTMPTMSMDSPTVNPFTASPTPEECICVPTPPPTPEDLLCAEDESSFQLTITFDAFPGDISWALVEGDGEGAVIAGDTNYSEGLKGKTIVASKVCVPTNACYTFVIRDSQGDGLCCMMGGGNYKIDIDNGADGFEGGIFSFRESMQFCVGEST
jgi:hypothetical protein